MTHLKVYLLAGLFLLAALPLRAAHLIGGELSYTCLGSNDYSLKLKIYRDCYSGGAFFDNPSYIFVYEAATGLLDRIVTLPYPGSTNIPPDLSNPCLVNPPDVCVEEAIYSGIVNLPPLAGGYNIVYQRCCRNATIVNLVDPGSTGSTYTAYVPDPGQGCNSSPEFKNFPPIVLCADDPISFDHSATDPDGDSLVYVLCSPFDGASPTCPMPAGPATFAGCPTEPGPPPYSAVSWWPGFSASTPLDALPALSIDPHTGLLTGTSLGVGQYVVGICVREYKAGVLVGTHNRDFQFNIAPCDPLIIAAFPFDIVDCDDLTVHFDNWSIGASNYSWDFGVPGGSSLDTFPTYTFPDTGVYTVTLTADPGLPCSDSISSTVSLYPTFIADFDYEPQCPGEKTQFIDETASTFGDATSWFWNFGDGSVNHLFNPLHVYTEGGDYDVSLVAGSDKGCLDTIVKTIQVPYDPDLGFTIENPCLNQPTVFTDTSFLTDGTITNWFWDFGDGDTANAKSATHIYTEPGLYAVNFYIVGSNGCTADTGFLLQINPDVVAEVQPADTICEGDDVLLAAGGGLYYQWTPGEGLADAEAAVTIASPTETTTYSVHVSDDCTEDSISVTVVVLPAPVSNAGRDTTIFRTEEVQLSAFDGVSYQWFPEEGLSDPTVSSPIASPWNSTTYYVLVTGENGCSRLDSVRVEVLLRCDRMIFPNAFTPNGDGQNDVFRPKNPGDDQLLEMSIYNRWGNKLFVTAENGHGWDGTLDGVPQPLDTYIYQVRAACGQREILKSGTVTLLR